MNHPRTITAAELIQKLSTLPPDAVIVFTARDQNGAWSNADIEPRTIAINTTSRNRSDHPHRIIEEFEDIADHRESYPDDTIIQGYEIC
jgi:hypothetical protein